jgi:hypothetical protein
LLQFELCLGFLCRSDSRIIEGGLYWQKKREIEKEIKVKRLRKVSRRNEFCDTQETRLLFAHVVFDSFK